MPVRRPAGTEPAGALPAGSGPAGKRPADAGPARREPARTGLAVIRGAVTAPPTARARREVLFCLAGIPFILPIPIAVGFGTAALGWLLTPPPRPPNIAWPDLLAGGLAAIAVAAVLVATGAARTLGTFWRTLAARPAGKEVPPPARLTDAHLATRLRDGAGWRVIGYLMLKPPAGLFGLYAIFFWVAGVVSLSYPLWWLSFREVPPGGTLSPVPVFTPIGLGSDGTFRVTTFGGTFAASAAGIGMLLAAPWVTRAAVATDRWLIARLLGPGRLAQRVHDLEQSRALAVDDSAAMLRRLERDLHDGAQVRLATLALNLGMAREKLGGSGDARDADAVRDLVDAALHGAREAIGDLRDLARGIHPPALDNGLADALATLAAGSAIPAGLEVSIPVRPTPAIETIAYFCASELLANAVKHSHAGTITIRAAGDEHTLRLTVTDDGTGGADPERGSGLAGLAQRVAVVDGSLAVASPPGGPTRVAVDLPLRA
jgi:signal transduction histidine kinase